MNQSTIRRLAELEQQHAARFVPRPEAPISDDLIRTRIENARILLAGGELVGAEDLEIYRATRIAKILRKAQISAEMAGAELWRIAERRAKSE
jgi:hypothetical protein